MPVQIINTDYKLDRIVRFMRVEEIRPPAYALVYTNAGADDGAVTGRRWLMWPVADSTPGWYDYFIDTLGDHGMFGLRGDIPIGTNVGAQLGDSLGSGLGVIRHVSLPSVDVGDAVPYPSSDGTPPARVGQLGTGNREGTAVEFRAGPAMLQGPVAAFRAFTPLLTFPRSVFTYLLAELRPPDSTSVLRYYDPAVRGEDYEFFVQLQSDQVVPDDPDDVRRYTRSVELVSRHRPHRGDIIRLDEAWFAVESIEAIQRSGYVRIQAVAQEFLQTLPAPAE